MRFCLLALSFRFEPNSMDFAQMQFFVDKFTFPSLSLLLVLVLFNFLFNVEQNVFLSCNLMSVAMRYGRYVSRNSKSSKFINQIGVFVFFLLFLFNRFCCYCWINFFLPFRFGYLSTGPSFICLKKEFIRIEWSRCEKWCCRDTSWWVERSKCMLLAIVWYGMCVHCSFLFVNSVCLCFFLFISLFFKLYISFWFGINFFHCYSLLTIHMKRRTQKMARKFKYFNWIEWIVLS